MLSALEQSLGTPSGAGTARLVPYSGRRSAESIAVEGPGLDLSRAPPWESSPEYLQRLGEIIETGIMYHYLRNKAQLLYLIFDRALRLALQRLDELADIADSRHQLAALIAHQVRTVGNEPSLGMTSWLYKWFDPAHDDPDEIAHHDPAHPRGRRRCGLGARLPAPASGLSAD